VLSFVCLALPAWADGQAGLDAYKRGDYATALGEWGPLAEQGDATAQYNFGVMYDFGKGVPQDFATARQWYEKAAARGHAGAQNNLGGLYEFGHGVTQDYVRAYMWYKVAAAHSTGDAQKDVAAENRDEIAGRSLAVETLSTLLAIARSDQPMPPQGAAKPLRVSPLRVSFDRPLKWEHTPAVPPAVLTISYAGAT
jgi:TPR repeat protein